MLHKYLLIMPQWLFAHRIYLNFSIWAQDVFYKEPNPLASKGMVFEAYHLYWYCNLRHQAHNYVDSCTPKMVDSAHTCDLHILIEVPYKYWFLSANLFPWWLSLLLQGRLQEGWNWCTAGLLAYLVAAISHLCNPARQLKSKPSLVPRLNWPVLFHTIILLHDIWGMLNQITCDVDSFPAAMSGVHNNQPMHVKCQWLTS